MSSKIPKAGSYNKKALDEILGKARNTLDQSRQFRDAELAGLRQPRFGTHVEGLGTANPKYYTDIRKLPVGGLAVDVPLRRPGPPKFEIKPKTKTISSDNQRNTEIESTEYETDRPRSEKISATQRKQYAANKSSSSSSGEASAGSSSSGDESDSTITPPTITGTPETSKRGSKVVTLGEIKNAELPPIEIGSLDLPSVTSFNKQGRNLLERTLLVRGDPVSQESYAVLKAMMFEKEHKDVDQQSYTEDFVSDDAANESSIEVPATATEIDQTEIPVDEDEMESFAESETMKETYSSIVDVEEIAENLKVLEVTDYVLNEEEPIPSMEEQIALSDLEALAKHEKQEDDELYSLIGKSKSTGEPPSTVVSSAAVKSPSLQQHHDSTGVSVSKSSNSHHNRDTSHHLPSSSSKSKSKSHKLSKSMMLSMLSKSRQSSRKTFQNVLSHVKIDEDKDINNGENAYVPPKTRPQRNIQSILEKEVYQKELKKLRAMQKREERVKKKAHETKAEALERLQAAKESGIVYREPSYTKILLPELINDPMMSATAQSSKTNLGAPYFNRDGSLGFDYSVENYPRSPSASFHNLGVKMDIPQLVREVLASNERMYKMTVDAAQEMGKEYGKNAKLLSKIKKNKELHRRHKKNLT